MRKTTAIGTFGLFVILLNFAIWIGSIWLTASVITSGIKAISQQCGSEFGIESIGVGGDWFCAKE